MRSSTERTLLSSHEELIPGDLRLALILEAPLHPLQTTEKVNFDLVILRILRTSGRPNEAMIFMY